MMDNYADLADDYYVNMTLSTEMDLAGSRETVLHYAEQIQKKYPEMRNFYNRDKKDYVLEEDKDGGSYRWCSFESRRIGSGQVNPQRFDDALEQHRYALELAPYALSLSPLDCEALDLLLGFDFTYQGNQNLLLAETLGVCPAFESLLSMPQSRFVNHEPTITLALDEDCRTQVRVGVESRTNAYQIRTGEFQPEQLSVYVTARKYGSLDKDATFAGTLDELSDLACEVVENYVAEAVLEPLARAIAMG